MSGKTVITLRELRIARGVSLRDLQAATGINRGQISLIEQGVWLPSTEQMTKIAGALDAGGLVCRLRFQIEFELPAPLLEEVAA